MTDFFVLETQIFLRAMFSTLKTITLNNYFLMQLITGFQNTEEHICSKIQKEKLLRRELIEFGLTNKVL